jgi:hypothetical protein
MRNAQPRASLITYIFTAQLLGLVVYVLFLITAALIEAYFVPVVAEKCPQTAPALVRAYIDRQEASALEAQCKAEWEGKRGQVQERTR